jgi:hypothetical protein
MAMAARAIDRDAFYAASLRALKSTQAWRDYNGQQAKAPKLNMSYELR